MQNYGLNLFFGTLWFIMIVVIVEPAMVGEWLAERDKTYTSEMSKYWTVKDMEAE